MRRGLFRMQEWGNVEVGINSEEVDELIVEVGVSCVLHIVFYILSIFFLDPVIKVLS